MAEKTGLGKAFIGLVLMSAVTSLPELMVGVSSSAILQSADLAVGDIIGSCAFNLGILSILDVFQKRDQTLLGQASQSHILAASLGIILIAIVGLGLFLPSDIVVIPSLGLTSVACAVMYFVSLRIISQYNKQHKTTEEESHSDSMTLQQVLIRYALFALVIIGAALLLPFFAEHIAVATGLGQSFVGTLFLAVSTSLPEIAVSIASVQRGAVDMAVGNLLGSNFFNVFILFLDDIFYTKGNLLKDASDLNLLSVFAVTIMSAITIIGLIFPSNQKRFLMAADTMLIFLVYVSTLVLLYNLQ